MSQEVTTTGRMFNPNIQCFIDSALELLRADDVKRALWILDNLPGWFRDNPPKEVTELKNEIHRRMATSSFYANPKICVEIDPRLNDESEANMEHSLRGALIIRDVSSINSHGFVPHLDDQGPGSYWQAMVLTKNGLKFTYKPDFMDYRVKEHHRARWDIAENYVEHKEERPKIFIACELIEHLHSPDEIRYQMMRDGGPHDIIHISTPLYSFGVECLDWKEKEDLGHYTTFTPTEFRDVILSLFPEYLATFYVSQIQHCRLVLKETKFDFIKNSASLNLIEADPVK